jgi:hypothetical protein
MEASIASTAATADVAPQIMFGLTSFGYSETMVGQVGPEVTALGSLAGTAPLATEGWLKVRLYIEPSAEALADTTPGGLTPVIVAINGNEATLANPDAVDVYVDNVRVYRTAMPDDIAFGSGKVDTGRDAAALSVGSRKRLYVDPALSNALAGSPLYGNFEAGTGAMAAAGTTTGGNVNGWVRVGAGAAGIVASVVSGANYDTTIEENDTNWLEFAMDGSSTAGQATIVRTRNVTPTDVDSPSNVWGTGLYVLSGDYHTSSSTDKDPQMYLGILDNGAQTYAYATYMVRTSNAVRRVRVPFAFRDLDYMQVLLAVVDAEGGTSGAVHFDNIMVDMLQDNVAYTDFSLFE